MKKLFKNFSKARKVQYLRGESEIKSTDKVELRGLKLNGNYDDLPNLVFFPDVFDKVENWLNFF